MKIWRLISSALVALGLAALCLIAPVGSPALAAQYTNCMPTTGTISGLTFSTDVTQALQSLNSSNLGSTAPATDCSLAPIAGQIWLNTSTSPYQYEIYDGASWQIIGYINATSHLWTPNGISAFGFRNRIYNGDFRFWTRGVNTFGSSVGCTTVCTYSADRWFVNATGAAITSSQASLPVTGFQYGITLTGATSNTSAYVAQRIESMNIFDQASQNDTLQASVFCSTAQSVKWAVYYPTATDNYTSESAGPSGTWSVTTSAATFTAAVSVPSGATNGLEIRFYPQAGSSFTSGSCTITGVQLESGTSATAFERLPFDVEQKQMTRYCISSYDYNVTPGTSTRLGLVAIAGYSTASGSGAQLMFNGTLRGAPTIFIYWDGAGNSVAVSYYVSSAWSDNHVFIGSTLASSSKGVLFSLNAAMSAPVMMQYLACDEL